MNSCSDKTEPAEKEEPETEKEEPEINNIYYTIDMDKNYRVHKVSCDHYENALDFNIEFSYYSDSIVEKRVSSYSGSLYITVTSYYTNNEFADSARSHSLSNNSVSSVVRSFFSYDTDGYLISRTDKNSYPYSSYTTSYTTTYEYADGNLIETTFDPLKPGSWMHGKYIAYTYGSEQNLIDLESFKGSWLGKLNRNLRKSYYVGGSMSDYPPCVKYTYVLRSDGLVEEMTEVSCRTESNYRRVSAFEYRITE